MEPAELRHISGDGGVVVWEERWPPPGTEVALPMKGDGAARACRPSGDGIISPATRMVIDCCRRITGLCVVLDVFALYTSGDDGDGVGRIPGLLTVCEWLRLPLFCVVFLLPL